MSWLSNVLRPGRPYKKAQDVMQQYYQQGQQQMQPYMQAGMDAYGQLSPALQALMNPEQLQAKWLESYTESPQATLAKQQAEQEGLSAASSMGMLGSTPALQALQAGTTQLGYADRQKYLDDLMNKYQTAIGLGQNIYGTGAQMAGQSASNAMNMGGAMGTLAAGQGMAGGSMLGGLLGGLGRFGMDYLTGGFGQGNYGRGAWSTTGG